MSTLDEIFTYLNWLFPDAKTELHYSTPFQLVVAVILSAQTTDKQVNKVTEKIFKKIKTPQDITTLWLNNLKKSINSIWLYNGKASNIYKLSTIIQDQTILKTLAIKKLNIQKEDSKTYYLPLEINDLQKLPWIGEKTAKVVAHILYNAPVIAVDTHVHRVTNRLWLVSTKTAEQTSKLLENIIPKKYKLIAHHCLILFWRYYCTARNPKCMDCKLQKICKRYQENKKA